MRMSSEGDEAQLVRPWFHPLFFTLKECNGTSLWTGPCHREREQPLGCRTQLDLQGPVIRLACWNLLELSSTDGAADIS